MLTTEQCRPFLGAKRKQIVAEICPCVWNPQTKTPHLPARIEPIHAAFKIPTGDGEASSGVKRYGDLIRGTWTRDASS